MKFSIQFGSCACFVTAAIIIIDQTASFAPTSQTIRIPTARFTFRKDTNDDLGLPNLVGSTVTALPDRKGDANDKNPAQYILRELLPVESAKKCQIYEAGRIVSGGENGDTTDGGSYIIKLSANLKAIEWERSAYFTITEILSESDRHAFVNTFGAVQTNIYTTPENGKTQENGTKEPKAKAVDKQQAEEKKKEEEPKVEAKVDKKSKTDDKKKQKKKPGKKVEEKKEVTAKQDEDKAEKKKKVKADEKNKKVQVEAKEEASAPSEETKEEVAVVETPPPGQIVAGLIMERGSDNLRFQIRQKGAYRGLKLKEGMYRVIKIVDTLHRNNLVWTEIKAENFVVLHGQHTLLKGIDLESVIPANYWLKAYSAESCPPEFPVEEIYKSLPKIQIPTQFDMWGLGMVLYEMATGKPLYEAGLQDVEYIRAQLANAPATIERANDKLRLSVPSGAREIIQKCLALNPQDRPSCQELLNDPYFQGMAQTTASQYKDLVI